MNRKIWVYETVPDDGLSTRQFEIRRSIRDAPLMRDPETGLPVRRVILGGIEIPRAPSAPRPKPSCLQGVAASCACCRPLP
jgi:hypothetical protein